MTNPTFILPSSPGIAANNLYALKVGNQPERFSPISGTFARSTTASRLNANGLIESIAINTPRLDYTYGSCPAVLLEPQRTNFVLFSEQLDNANYSKTNATITANATTAPDGTTTADYLVESATAGTHSVAQTVTYAANNTVSVSVFAKSVGRNLQIDISDTSTGNVIVNCDLSAGTIAYSGLSGSWTFVSMSITPYINGWYRCSLVATKAAGNFVQFNLRCIQGASTNNYTGTGSNGLYLWGAQVETGAYPTTYIPTTTATVTRTADSFSYSNIFTNGYVSSQGGTWLIELKNNISYVRDISVVGIFIGDSNSGLTNSFAISALGGGGRLRIGKFLSNIYTQLYLTTTDNVKIAIKWNGATADIFVNSVKQVSATVFTATLLEYLYHSTSSEVPKFIQSMALFSTPLSDSECALLTSDTYGSFATLASSTSYTLS